MHFWFWFLWVSGFRRNYLMQPGGLTGGKTEDDDYPSTKIYQLQIISREDWDPKGPCPIHNSLLTHPVLGRLNAGNQSCFEIMFVMVMSCDEHSISHCSVFLIMCSFHNVLWFLEREVYMSYLGLSTRLSLILNILKSHDLLYKLKFILKRSFFNYGGE